LSTFFIELESIYKIILENKNAQFKREESNQKKWADYMIKMGLSETILQRKDLLKALPLKAPHLKFGGKEKKVEQESIFVLSLDET